ncbi:MAG: DUF4388 domain-containing protein [Vicinamibacteria bacterium]
MTLQGPITEGLLPTLLRDLYVGRKTGTLVVRHDSTERSVRFRRGHIVHAGSNLNEEHLGELLVRLGLLDAKDFEDATAIVLRDKKRLGAALIEIGALDEDRLEDLLALHVREILLKLFTRHEGSYVFQEDESDLPGEDDRQLKLSTGEMILEAVRRVQDEDVVRFALGDPDRILGLSSDPLLRFQKITLTPVDGFLLSRVDGTLSAREVIELAPVPAEEAQKSLFGLLSTGTLEYLPLPPKPRPARAPTGRFRLPRQPTRRFVVPKGVAAAAAAAGGTHPAAQSDAATPSPPAAEPPQPAAIPPAAQAADEEKLKALLAQRDEIQSLHASLKTATHFEILGIPRASGEAQVKEAYFKLARRFHPDTQHDPALADLADAIEAIFIRIGAAYDILRNARTRASYEERLGPSRTPPHVTSGPAPAATASAPQAGSAAQQPAATTAAAPAPVAPPSLDPDSLARAAEAAIRRGEKLYSDGKFWDVITEVEPHLEHARGKSRVRGRLLLARCYLKNPNWLKRGEEELQQVIKLDPTTADAYMLLGTVYKGQGLKSRAAGMFKKVLQLRPEASEAEAELKSLGLEEPAPPPEPPAGGLLKKLFGRG